MKHLITLLALLLVGCGSELPDRREAIVVVEDDSLGIVVAQAVQWWSEATAADVRLTVGTECADERACVRVRSSDKLETMLGEAAPDAWAVTNCWEDSKGRDGANISFLSTLKDQPQGLVLVVVAHELGHSLELEHVEGEGEVMRPNGDTPAACIGPETQAEYAKMYGAARLSTVCR